MANLKEMSNSRTSLLWFDPERLSIKPGLNGRDLTAPENLKHIAEIADSIEANGFMKSKPLEIFLEGDHIFIADGGCRYAAIQLCKTRGVVVEKVPCVEEARGTNDVDRILRQDTHNSSKRLTLLELGANIKRAIALGETVGSVAKKLGKSLTYVNQALDFQAAPAEVHALVKSGAVSATLAQQTVRREGGAAGASVLKEAVRAAKSEGKAKATAKQVAPLAKPVAVKKAPEIVVEKFEALGVDDDERPGPVDTLAELRGALRHALDALEAFTADGGAEPRYAIAAKALAAGRHVLAYSPGVN